MIGYRYPPVAAIPGSWRGTVAGWRAAGPERMNTVAIAAVPIAPPTCRMVLMKPDAAPARAGRRFAYAGDPLYTLPFLKPPV
jgi:hypothetical protein